MLAIVGSERYTAAEVAELAGAQASLLLALRHAAGLPVPAAHVRSYLCADVQALRAAALARSAGTPEETLLELIRQLARGLSRSRSAMHALALRIALEPTLAEVELSRICERAAAELAPLVRPLVANLLVTHLCAAATSPHDPQLSRL